MGRHRQYIFCLITAHLHAMVSRKVLPVLLLPLSVLSAPCHPGDGWVPGGGGLSCYLISPDKMSWFEAQEFCGSNGGYLAEINTQAEQAFLSTILSSSSYYWLGLADLAHPGQYTWQHSWQSPAFTNWGAGEPDGGSQHCVFQWGGHEYQWADYLCDEAASSGGHDILALCETGGGQEPEPGLSVLWLGNSYTFRNDVPLLVSKLASSDGRSLDYASHAESSWTWEMHASSEETLTKIRQKKWDVVVLQEQSRRPAYDNSQVCKESVPFLDILSDQIRANNPDTIIQFYLTWGRPFGSVSDCESEPQFCQFPTMQDALTHSYSAFACMKQPARVAPAGEGFRYFYDRDDFLDLYNDAGEDHHASPAGSYLSAVTHYAALFNTSVVGNTYHGELDKDTALLMQEVGSNTWFGQDWNYEVGKDCAQCFCGC